MKNEILEKFRRRFPNERACRKYLIDEVWKGKVKCPYCGNDRKVYRYTNGQFRCAECRKLFRILTGTVYSGIRLPLRKIFMAMYVLSVKTDMSARALAAMIEVNRRSAGKLRRKFNELYNQEGIRHRVQRIPESMHPGKNRLRVEAVYDVGRSG